MHHRLARTKLSLGPRFVAEFRSDITSSPQPKHQPHGEQDPYPKEPNYAEVEKSSSE